VRLVRRNDNDGTVRVLMTNLRDRDQVTPDDLFDLYRRRWGIENAFRDLKLRYAAEDFHGTTPNLIEQEIIVHMLLFLCESMVEETAIRDLRRNERPDGNDRRPQRHNRAALGDRLPLLMDIGLRTTTPRRMLSELLRGMAALAGMRAPVRRPRTYPRECKRQYGRWRFVRSTTAGQKNLRAA
jgi:hypothetical protein